MSELKWQSAMPITSPTMLTRQYEDIFVLGTEEAMIDMEVFWCGTKIIANNKK